MAENVPKQHTGIPISEFLAGRGEPPPPPPPPPAHTGIPISEFLAGRGAAPTTTMPGPSPGTEAALARGMEAEAGHGAGEFVLVDDPRGVGVQCAEQVDHAYLRARVCACV